MKYCILGFEFGEDNENGCMKLKKIIKFGDEWSVLVRISGKTLSIVSVEKQNVVFRNVLAFGQLVIFVQ